MLLISDYHARNKQDKSESPVFMMLWHFKDSFLYLLSEVAPHALTKQTYA